ncbi:snurportin-1 [Anopheles cruzii]|uniref:snurportin-1 n=1 Tax=Anopheles cruzii TaxID=68878 RepID=UPI0022EC7593|nr:snurportin-1 [Anopheles cruzii]
MCDSKEPASRFEEMYKYNGRLEHEMQAERRERLLAEQRLARQREVDAGRPGLVEEIEGQTDNEGETMECHQEQPPAKHKSRRTKSTFSRLYSNKVQLSEWMHERPADFENWIVVPCPVGARCLLVIHKMSAIAYHKGGRSITATRTNFRHFRGTTVLDCVYTENPRHFYVLDVLIYRHLDLVHYECQFRFAWIKAKFDEDNLSERFTTKPPERGGLGLSLLPTYDCAQPESLATCWSHYPAFRNDSPRLDGFLFYHKESHYIHGLTPLVTWLFQFMLTDVLQLPSGMVNSGYLDHKPASYTGDYAKYIGDFERRRKKRKLRHRHPAKKRKTKHMSIDDAPAVEPGDHLALWEAMEAAPLDSEDEDLRPKELDAIRELEMEG